MDDRNVPRSSLSEILTHPVVVAAGINFGSNLLRLFIELKLKQLRGKKDG